MDGWQGQLGVGLQGTTDAMIGARSVPLRHN
jgi:hypothetical protein